MGVDVAAGVGLGGCNSNNKVDLYCGCCYKLLLCTIELLESNNSLLRLVERFRSKLFAVGGFWEHNKHHPTCNVS